MELDQAIENIVRLNEHICDFWGNGGWAPNIAAEMLSKLRLDWQISLSKNLLRWVPVPDEDEYDGSLILAWVNLGALVEGTMIWFLCVFHDSYSSSPIMRKGKAIEQNESYFSELCRFFQNIVWTNNQKEQWESFVNLVRERRNAVHAYKDRPIGSFNEFYGAVIKYRNFLLAHEKQVPYPDEQFSYPDDISEMRQSD